MCLSKCHYKCSLVFNAYAMIGEVIKRRYYRLSEENSPMPDLVLIDGGKGQLKSATDSLQSLRVMIPCVSLAKKNEEIFLPKRKNPVIISKKEPSLKILQYARDEAHRFGVKYNRDLRKIIAN